MNRVIEIAAAALASGGGARRLGAVAQRGVAGIACAALATGFAAAAVGCGVAALWLYADRMVGPVGAALAAAGALLTVAVLLLAAARCLIRPRRRHPPAALGGADVARLMAGHKGTLLIAAAILGMLAGSDEQHSGR
jgi:hypothetical protein